MALDKFQPYLFVSAGEQSNKYLTPTITNGIAQFQAQRAQSLTDLTVRIDPIQEGSGDPSPTNIRPISGRTGLTVTRAGKNLLANKKVISGNSIYLGTDVISPPYYNMRAITLHAGTYTLSVETADGITTNMYAAKTGVKEEFARALGAKSLTFTLSETTGCYFWVYKPSYSTVGVGAITQFQLELGSTATAYESYTAQTYPVTWETEAGTVYGGTLDVVSGVLTVDKVLTTFDGTGVAWGKYTPTSGNYCFRTTISDMAAGLNPMYANNYKALTSHAFATSDYGVFSGHVTLPQVYFRPPNASVVEVEDWNTWLAANNLQVVYPLATPQTYQLTPTEVRTIAGFNQIYSDAGPVIDIKF